jgi:hypothetical protein
MTELQAKWHLSVASYYIPSPNPKQGKGIKHQPHKTAYIYVTFSAHMPPLEILSEPVS